MKLSPNLQVSYGQLISNKVGSEGQELVHNSTHRLKASSTHNGTGKVKPLIYLNSNFSPAEVHGMRRLNIRSKASRSMPVQLPEHLNRTKLRLLSLF